MKMILKTLAAAAMLAALTADQAAAMDLTAPIPEFRSQSELQAEIASRAAASGLPTDDAEQLDTFYTGKPCDGDSGTHIFLFRNYDPALSCWTSADPSGFPDGANSLNYCAIPTSEFDWQGLKSVAFLYGWYDPTNSTVWTSASDPSSTWRDSDFHNYASQLVAGMNQQMNDADSASGSSTNYINDGDYLSFGALTSWTQLGGWEGSYDRVYVIAHGATSGSEMYYVNGVGWAPGNWGSATTVWGCNPTQGEQSVVLAGSLFYPIADFLYE